MIFNSRTPPSRLLLQFAYVKHICVMALVILICDGCTLLGLHEDLAKIAETAEISGQVLVSTETENTIFVALYNKQAGDHRLYSYWATDKFGNFRFLVPPGEFYVFAFEDKNGDAAFQSTERVGWYGDPSPIIATAGSVARRIKFKLRIPSNARSDLPSVYAQLTQSVPMNIQERHLGTLVKLSDERFSDSYASKGLWEPVKFLQVPGAGLFFLEPYNETKIPILFIHGVSGYPQQWEAIIDSLDKSRFQAWVLQYPSGLRLGLLGEFLEKYIAELQLKYRFRHLFIVAHSMGGLIARDAVNHHLEKHSSPIVKQLITISTPWQGHASAATGVKHSPLVIPSWVDMAPNSLFLKELHATALPDNIEFNLIFGYRGDANSNGELSDDTVLLSSMLDNDMQQVASKVYGFDEGHTRILKSQPAIIQLQRLLTSAADRVNGVPKQDDQDCPLGAIQSLRNLAVSCKSFQP